MAADRIVELDLGVVPEAAVSGAVCLQTARGTFLTFNAMRWAGRMGPYGPILDDAGTAIVGFPGCLVSRFGYPNDEARWKIPRYAGLGYGIYEVLNSTWSDEVRRLNTYAFPTTEWGRALRHFVLTFHDDTFECLAEDLTLEVSTDPYDLVFDRVRRIAFDDEPLSR